MQAFRRPYSGIYYFALVGIADIILWKVVCGYPLPEQSGFYCLEYGGQKLYEYKTDCRHGSLQNYFAPALHFLPSAYEQGLFLVLQLSAPIWGGGVDSIHCK